MASSAQWWFCPSFPARTLVSVRLFKSQTAVDLRDQENTFGLGSRFLVCRRIVPVALHVCSGGGRLFGFLFLAFGVPIVLDIGGFLFGGRRRRFRFMGKGFCRQRWCRYWRRFLRRSSCLGPFLLLAAVRELLRRATRSCGLLLLQPLDDDAGSKESLLSDFCGSLFLFLLLS